MKLERIRLFIERTLLGDAIPEWRIPEVRVFESSRDDFQ
jgi:hypothetical protein